MSELTPAGSLSVRLQSEERQPELSESEAGKLFQSHLYNRQLVWGEKKTTYFYVFLNFFFAVMFS